MSGIKIVVAGATGRMGQTLLRAIAENKDFTLHAALERKGHPDLGNDAGTLAGLKPLGVALSDDPLMALKDAQALVDFTSPAYSVELAALSAQGRLGRAGPALSVSSGKGFCPRPTRKKPAPLRPMP